MKAARGYIDTLSSQLAERDKALIEAKAMRAKAEFKLDHREWSHEFREGCVACKGQLDERHTWADEQWREAAKA